MDKVAFDYQNEVDTFIKKIANAETNDVQDDFSNLIRSHIKENSFAEKILPAVSVDESQCQVSETPGDETFRKLIWKEPDARAQYITFHGTPESEFIHMEKVFMPFGAIATRKFEKHEEQLRVYKGVPFVKLVEANAAMALGDIQDALIMGLSRNAVAANGLDISAAGMPFNKDTLITLLNAPHSVSLKNNILLMTETTFNNFARQGTEVFGDQMVGEIIRDGFKYKTLMGVPIITTMKYNLITDNEIYGYPAPEFLGRFYVLEKEKFIVKKEDGIVSWYSRKNIGMIFVNINGVCRIRLNGYLD